MPELVSIIIPTYNRPDTLKRAISSALNQQYENVEILVINDGGMIGNLENEFNDARIGFYHLEINGGVSAARNHGIENASGNFLLFLDDDDELASDFLENALNRISENSDILIAHAELNGNMVDSHFRKIKKLNDELFHQYHYKSTDSWFYFLYYMPAFHSILFRTGLFEQVKFNETIQYSEDRLLMLEFRNQNVTMQPVDLIAGTYHYHQKVINPSKIHEFTTLARSTVTDRKSIAYTRLLDAFYWYQESKYLRFLHSIIHSLKSPHVVVKQFVLFLRLIKLR
ncbi:glycosyltransferase family 2 protein [Marinoscillum pacificum]|uniref:glycosyltransferase family 2 protein n=1 Tax=Marinoscillum pacificum TaxID=392723 RepID=UPI0021589670|nr:glycosyltransferase [Marinoscillum pacificum]